MSTRPPFELHSREAGATFPRSSLHHMTSGQTPRFLGPFQLGHVSQNRQYSPSPFSRVWCTPLACTTSVSALLPVSNRMRFICRQQSDHSIGVLKRVGVTTMKPLEPQRV